jgi:hypothetical protein
LAVTIFNRRDLSKVEKVIYHQSVIFVCVNIIKGSLWILLNTNRNLGTITKFMYIIFLFFFFYFPLVEGYFVHLDIIKKFEKVFPPWCYSIFLCFWNWILNYWWLRREKVYWEKKLCDGGSLKIYNYLSSFIENNNLIEHSVRKCLVSRNVIGSHGANRGVISVYHL